jgi:hypothetical protein
VVILPYEIKQDVEGCSGYAVVLKTTGKIVGCHKTKEDATKHLVALKINVEDKEEMEKMQFGHGSKVPFKIEFSVPDCQNGWAVLKENNGQVVGCYTSEEEAKKAVEALVVQVEGYEEKGQEEEKVPPTSIWNGSFAPVFGTKDQDARFVSTYNTPPQKDGKPSAGYGNRSGYGYSNQ